MNYQFYLKDGRPAFGFYCLNWQPTPQDIAQACALLNISETEIDYAPNV